MVEGEAGLRGVHLEDLAAQGAGAEPVLGQVDAEHAEQPAARVAQGRVERVEGVPGVGVVERLDVGDPAAGDVGRQPVVRQEAQLAPLVGDRHLGEDLLGRRALAHHRLDRARVTGDGEALEVAVRVEAVDHREPEPEHVDHALAGSVEQLLEVGHGVHPGHQVVEAAERQHLT